MPPPRRNFPRPPGLARAIGSVASLDLGKRTALGGATIADWESLGRVAKALVREPTLQRVGQVAVEEAQRVLGSSLVGLWLMEDGRTLRLLAQRGYSSASIAELERVPLDSTFAVAATARAGVPLEIPDLRKVGPDLAMARRIAEREGLTSAYSLPLLVLDRLVGVMNFVPAGRQQVRTTTPRQWGMMRAFADLCAAAVENARRAEAERHARAEAEAAVQARDEFLGVAAHELRTPLTSVRGYAQLMQRSLERGLLDEERLARSLGILLGASERLAALADDLLDVSRIRSGQLALRMAELDLTELVRRVAEAFHDRLDEQHRLVLDLPEAVVPIVGDVERLRQVLENLLENALKYSPSGGTINVSLGTVDDEALLHVGDEGIGLPSDALEGIFEPFGRASNASQLHLPGMGLGLYICRSIVARHGGSIWAESPGEERGATFGVALPLKQPG